MRRSIVRSLFAALYEPLAPVYDHVAALAFAGEWTRWQVIALSYAEREPTLELGCGTGQVQALLRARGHESVGIDIAGPMLRQARRRAPGRLICASAERVPLRSASVGTILSIFPTAYILAPRTWREAERLLCPGGRFIIATHGWLSGDDPWRKVLSAGHGLVYGHLTAPVPPLPYTTLAVHAVDHRSAHGQVHLLIATQPDRCSGR